MHTGTTHEARPSRFRTAKDNGPVQAVGGTVAPKGSDAAKALILADYSEKPNSPGTIPMICDRALPGHALGAAVTTTCMGRLRVWVQSGEQGDSSDETELNPQGNLDAHHFPGWQHSPTHFTPIVPQNHQIAQNLGTISKVTSMTLKCI